MISTLSMPRTWQQTSWKILVSAKLALNRTEFQSMLSIFSLNNSLRSSSANDCLSIILQRFGFSLALFFFFSWKYQLTYFLTISKKAYLSCYCENKMKTLLQICKAIFQRGLCLSLQEIAAHYTWARVWMPCFGLKIFLKKRSQEVKQFAPRDWDLSILVGAEKWGHQLEWCQRRLYTK